MKIRSSPDTNDKRTIARLLKSPPGPGFPVAVKPADPPRLVERGELIDWLGSRLAVARVQLSSQTVIVIEIDQMRGVNETQGYTHGDRLLAELNLRLRQALDGVAEIVRIGGNEFVVVPSRIYQNRAEATSAIMALAERLLCIVQQPIELDNEVNWMTASLGFAVAKDYPTAEFLLQEAEMALASAKAQDGNQVQTFLPAMRVAITDTFLLDADLRAAIRNEEFEVYAQPQALVGEHAVAVTGHELLVRWNHPKRGLLAPAQFIFHAEKTGLIRHIDLWMFEQACRLLASWRDDSTHSSRRLSVNISTAHFRDPDFADKIVRIIARTGAPAKKLTLEVTESMVLEDVRMAKLTMVRLRRLGLSLSLDDFGAGYSSLGLIVQLPFNEIKIDRSLVSIIGRNQRAEKIIASLIRLSWALGLRVIAEGVETQDQTRWLVENGCCAVQGFLFGRPEPMCRIPEGDMAVS